jgi:osmotically-inducible protein OsmY
MVRNDNDILKDVIAELQYDPGLRNDDIAVSVREGVVTLAGFVDSYAEKWKAERAAARVKGVRAVANDLEVKLPANSQRPDPELARAVADALKWNVLVPHERIKVTVDHGWVTLEGDADWFYQKEEAEKTVRNLTGVKGITNLITVYEQPVPSDVKQRIRDALERAAAIDADRVNVEVDGHKVILRGTVASFAEAREAEQAARSAPGVTEVDNRLVVDPSVYAGV